MSQEQSRPLTPDPTRPVRRQRQDPMSLEQVQRWVLSTFAVLTIAHFAAGIVLAAIMLDPPRLEGRIVLLILAAVTGVAGVFAGLAIHRHRLLSPWLLLGTLPALGGVYYLFLR